MVKMSLSMTMSGMDGVIGAGYGVVGWVLECDTNVEMMRCSANQVRVVVVEAGHMGGVVPGKRRGWKRGGPVPSVPGR